MIIDVNSQKNSGEEAELGKESQAIDKSQKSSRKIASCVRTTKSIRRQLGLKHISISMVEHYIR